LEKGQNRRKYSSVVNKSLQYRFLAMILIYGFILLAFFGITLFLPEIRQMHNESLSMAVRGAAAERILSKHVWVWPAVVLLVCLMGIHSFMAFHRVAGPLYRFRRSFERVRDGNLGFQVRIREKDYLHSEESSLNEMLESISNRIRSIQEISDAALRSFEKIERSIGNMGARNDPGPKLESYMRSHSQTLRELADALKFFKLGRG
jgi:methyl-accepting chemotaxis protein